MRQVRRLLASVVSYRNSTSNHNNVLYNTIRSAVVSYRNSTSNHNSAEVCFRADAVVSYRNSTSNHNPALIDAFAEQLYLIEILHQTTTNTLTNPPKYCCILSKFYIKPQQSVPRHRFSMSCILSKFYIKPQRLAP